ncbi:MAG: molybdopterin converting factor subunit 1 [Planctomycetaceae bacterium]
MKEQPDPAAALTVTVLFFAAAADIIQRETVQLQLHEGVTLADLQQQLYSRWPELSQRLPTLMWAVNEQYATPQTILRAGDQVACIPPVSGG